MVFGTKRDTKTDSGLREDVVGNLYPDSFPDEGAEMTPNPMEFRRPEVMPIDWARLLPESQASQGGATNVVQITLTMSAPNNSGVSTDVARPIRAKMSPTSPRGTMAAPTSA